ncbi:hypothetical protein [Glacieibacterium frigidum]|uniref:Uncharacterized protein n=1 Tax=Glacieibacterium frigidum TaxID=2593303 RepID=A0A552U8F4_9SPHN|nr:hypothetical protein [Glacieibacterium frigidum]TRW14496.1 hypothetical protein FMM06_12380 [Glacieibacterium frigidum]
MSKTAIGDDDEPKKPPEKQAETPRVAPSKREKSDEAEPAVIAGSDALIVESADAQGGALPEAVGITDAEQCPGAAAADDAAEADVATQEDTSPAPPPWSGLTVAIIDDAMHPPRLDRLDPADIASVSALLSTNSEVLDELRALGVDGGASVDERLRALAESDEPLLSLAKLGAASRDATRMVEEHRSFRRLRAILEAEVQDVAVCDPFNQLPDLSRHNLILLDYFLEGPAGGRTLSVAVANALRAQANRESDQQIVLMSSLETVRDARGDFRSETELTGSAFAFVGKPDLNEPWKVKAHLGMLERARPYAPAFNDYRAGLDDALSKAREELLKLVDDLDIGDYAFLQSRALMKDGHPLGDYVFWLLSSQLMALAFERDEMRTRQRALDALEFVGAPFAATEPSTVVANLLHSALVSRNMGPLGPHPRAKTDSAYAAFPLVQLGDVFLDEGRTKAVVVMSADCDLAFSPMPDREPDADTPVMLLPGVPVKMKDAKDGPDPNTDGLLHREEVYRIVWDLAKYRAVPLGQLNEWFQKEGYDVSNRDRLRPLFALKLQQEFGAHLMRVGPPILPPTTVGVGGRMIVCTPEKTEVGEFTPDELMVTRLKGSVWLRVTTRIAGALRVQCEALRSDMEEQRDAAPPKKKGDWQRKIDALSKELDNDDYWIGLLENMELNAVGSVKTVGPIGVVVGCDWTDNKMRVVLEVAEAAPPRRGRGRQAGPQDVPTHSETSSVSAAA